jgi:flagellar biosynthesis/type III secretory pathway chaperone
MVSYPEVEPLVAQLLAVLDEEAALLELRRVQMEDLFGAIARRDDPSMERLLAAMEQAQARQGRTDQKLNAIRTSLGRQLGCPARETRISLLARRLPAPWSGTLRRRARQLTDLAERLRRQHLETSFLLSECSRINRLMLENLGVAGTLTTYQAGGATTWHDGGIISAEL